MLPQSIQQFVERQQILHEAQVEPRVELDDLVFDQRVPFGRELADHVHPVAVRDEVHDHDGVVLQTKSSTELLSPDSLGLSTTQKDQEINVRDVDGFVELIDDQEDALLALLEQSVVFLLL